MGEMSEDNFPGGEDNVFSPSYHGGSFGPSDFGDEFDENGDEPDIFAEPETNQDTIAAIVGTNRTYVYDAIRECTNLTPADFINGYRLRHAATLLATTDHSVALIAELCGLSRRTFYRLFNDTYSMSPSDYRKVASKV